MLSVITRFKGNFEQMLAARDARRSSCSTSSKR